MLIEQIFELRGPGPPGLISTPITGCFRGKTLISLEKFSSRSLFAAKILPEANSVAKGMRAGGLEPLPLGL